jgi:predicted dinucleotide-binding enzyme
MTNHRIENGRRKFLLTVAGGIAGLAAGSLPARVLAQPAGGPPLNISTIGAGREGGALGALFVKAGHRVMFSSRHPDTLKGLVDELGPLARVGTVAEAVEFGDVVMVVVPYTAMEQIGRDYGDALAKKVLVIDVSNPFGAEIVKLVDDQGGAGLATAKFLPGAHIVRAFNAINYAKLSADAHRQGELVGVPIAGDDAHAIDIASSLIREIGFDPVVIGGLAMGKYLVPRTPLGGEHTAAEIRQIVTNLH